MFEDPCGLFDFELPIGWEYDVETPELERLSFVRWDRPQETLSLSALSPFAPSGSSLIEWRKAAEQQAVLGSRLQLKPANRGEAPSFAAEVTTEDGSLAERRRYLVRRGKYLDILAEHIAPEPALRPPLTQAVGRRGVRAQRTRRQQSG